MRDTLHEDTYWVQPLLITFDTPGHGGTVYAVHYAYRPTVHAVVHMVYTRNDVIPSHVRVRDSESGRQHHRFVEVGVYCVAQSISI